MIVSSFQDFKYVILLSSGLLCFYNSFPQFWENCRFKKHFEIILQKSYNNSSEFTYTFHAASSNVDTYITTVYASKIRK